MTSNFDVLDLYTDGETTKGFKMKTKEEILSEWNETKEQLTELKAKEMELRNTVLSDFFDFDYDDRQGTTTVPLGDGYKLKAAFSLRYKLENKGGETEDMLSSFIAEFGDQGQFIADRLVKWEPKISVSEYKKLTDEQRDTVDSVLVTTPATPSMQIVKPKDKK